MVTHFDAKLLYVAFSVFLLELGGRGTVHVLPAIWRSLPYVGVSDLVKVINGVKLRNQPATPSAAGIGSNLHFAVLLRGPTGKRMFICKSGSILNLAFKWLANVFEDVRL